MSNIKIQKIGVTKLDVDAVVNAANSGLWEGAECAELSLKRLAQQNLPRPAVNTVIVMWAVL